MGVPNATAIDFAGGSSRAMRDARFDTPGVFMNAETRLATIKNAIRLDVAKTIGKPRSPANVALSRLAVALGAVSKLSEGVGFAALLVNRETSAHARESAVAMRDFFAQVLGEQAQEPAPPQAASGTGRVMHASEFRRLSATARRAFLVGGGVVENQVVTRGGRA